MSQNHHSICSLFALKWPHSGVLQKNGYYRKMRHCIIRNCKRYKYICLIFSIKHYIHKMKLKKKKTHKRKTPTKNNKQQTNKKQNNNNNKTKQTKTNNNKSQHFFLIKKNKIKKYNNKNKTQQIPPTLSK